jgi:hypothetical protein
METLEKSGILGCICIKYNTVLQYNGIERKSTDQLIEKEIWFIFESIDNISTLLREVIPMCRLSIVLLCTELHVKV